MNPIAIVTYESRYARCGGVTAVLNHLPGHLQAAAGSDVVVITPYHFQIRETVTLATRIVAQVDVPFAGQAVPITVHRHDERGAWLFLDARGFLLPIEQRVEDGDTHFFAGRRHPYDVGSHGAAQLAILRRDALLFGVAVAQALPRLGPGPWSLLLQDWQAATAALALASASPRPRMLLTMHNSYDSGGLPPEELRRVGIDSERVGGADGADGATVVNRAWPLVQKPIITVSEQFALDITEDPFQKYVMADQLQSIMAPPNLIGINNGPFAALGIPGAALAAAQRGDLAALRGWKATQRHKAVAALRAFTPTAERVVWGDVASFVQQAEHEDAASFVLAGRDDPRQKGYDVAAAAVEAYFDEPGHAPAQFLFFPIPGDEGRPGLGFLQTLAERHPGRVLVLPFIFSEGYQAALQGADFGVMPSLYEPFGMANEFYLNGAVAIGRATGGLVQQIVPARNLPSWTPAVERRAERWHAADAPATGILYRETDDVPNVVADLRRLNTAAYELSGPNDRVAARLPIPVYRAMVDALRVALCDAAALRAEDALLAMLIAGIEHTQRAFSWERTAAEYVRMLR